MQLSANILSCPCHVPAVVEVIPNRNSSCPLRCCFVLLPEQTGSPPWRILTKCRLVAGCAAGGIANPVLHLAEIINVVRRPVKVIQSLCVELNVSLRSCCDNALCVEREARGTNRHGREPILLNKRSRPQYAGVAPKDLDKWTDERSLCAVNTAPVEMQLRLAHERLRLRSLRH